MIKRLRSVLKFLPFALLLGLPLALSWPAAAEPAEPAELLSPEAGPTWSSIIAITNPSNSPNGAERPVVAAAPDGKTVMVAYLNLTNNANDADAFYRVSRDNGATWEQARAIKHTPTRARQVHITYDINNQAHAVWTERNDTNSANPFVLAYAKENNWHGTSPIYQTVSNALLVMDSPRIIASGSQRLDLVWAQFDGSTGNVNIFHARSTNANQANPIWTAPKAIRNTAPESKSPDIAIDDRSYIHVVWEEQDPSNITVAKIYYTRSIDGGTTWSNPIPVSSKSSPTDARRPRIIADGNRLHITFTDNEAQDSQFVHHLSCSAANCTNLTNWVSSGKISGGKLGIRTVDPADIISTLTQQGTCTYAYFHGININVDPNNEMIWGTGSCDNWSSRIRLTATGVRAIKPSMTAHGKWWVYLTYERVTNTDRQIRFVRSRPTVYLPILLR